jgi:hypothetical protein
MFEFLLNDQLDAQFFSMYLFQFSTCFEQPRAHHQENQFYQYNICVGDHFVCRSERNFISILCMFRTTSCPSSGESIVSVQHLVCVTLCRWPFRVQVGKELSDLHTKRSPTQSDIYQMLYWYNWFSWWWARSCSKHVENWNKCREKNCASSWSFIKNHNKIHDQQHIECLNVDFTIIFSSF